MGFIKGFTATAILKNSITKKDKQNCISILIKEGFLGYDYELESYVDFNIVLEKYPNRPRYLSKYRNEDFIISCLEGKKYLGYNIDNDGKNSKIIIKVTNEICKTLDSISYVYIDDLGNSPDYIVESIENKLLKWLFKYNYFGNDFIEKFGKDFFTNMPCVKHEFLTNEIIKIDLVKDIFSPIDKSLMKEVSDYLKTFSINVNFYNHKNFLID